MVFKKNDFVEIAYSGFAEGVLFDTTEEEVAKEHQVFDSKTKYVPLIVCLGDSYIIPGLEEEIMKRGFGDSFTITVGPGKGFGFKQPSLIKLVPERVFQKEKIKPVPGLQVSIDNERGQVLRVNSGRVMVDFNHPLAGKTLRYDVKILRRVEKISEKAKAYVERVMPVKAEVSGESDLVISLPLDLPEQVAVDFSKKIVEKTGAASVKFFKKGETNNQKGGV